MERSGERTRARPLTDRVLERVPGSRPLWIAGWTLVPWLNAGLNLLLVEEGTSGVWEQSTALVILNYAALSVAVLVSVWGASSIARRLEDLRPGISAALRDEEREPFRHLASSAGPVLASVATAIAFGGAALARDGWTAALLRGTTWFVLGIALWTFLWTYASLQLGLDRLGRARLDPDAAHVDPGLGLQPLGRVAYTGLWMLLAWLVPVLLTGLPDVVGVAIGLAVLATGLAAFFLSLLRLHRQMAFVKAAEVAVARTLYAQAYAPVHEARTLEALDRQRDLLAAASALEKRAGAIHEWPIDEGTLARVITITTSVIAMIIGRLILDPLGL